jgi:hypothetical protein
VTIKAIETRYAGCRFRSRLEARWARFFDHLRIPWEYEPEGFETTAGPYLPDFRIKIPQIKDWGHHQWLEAKPDNAPADPRHAAFAAAIADPVIVARGLPRDYDAQLLGHRSPLMAYNVNDREPWPVAFCDSVDLSFMQSYCALGDNRHWCQEAMNHTLAGETCHLALYGHHPADEQRPDVFPGYMTYPPFLAPAIDDAYAAARSARFEHGEQG